VPLPNGADLPLTTVSRPLGIPVTAVLLKESIPKWFRGFLILNLHITLMSSMQKAVAAMDEIFE